MPVYTCEFTQNNEKHIAMSIAENADKAMRQGFLHMAGKMNKGTVVDRASLKKFENPSDAHKEMVAFAQRNKLPIPGTPEAEANVIDLYPEPVVSQPPPEKDEDE